MEKIFLIWSNSCDYDSPNQIIGFTTSEDKAKESVEALKELYRKAREFRDKVLYPAHSEYSDANPRSFKPLIPIEKWPAGISEKQITHEMMEKRVSVQNQNQLIIEENSAKEKDWQINYVKFLAPIIEPIKNEPWFEKWVDVGEKFVAVHAVGLAEGHEYFYEECEELKIENLNTK